MEEDIKAVLVAKGLDSCLVKMLRKPSGSIDFLVGCYHQQVSRYSGSWPRRDHPYARARLFRGAVHYELSAYSLSYPLRQARISLRTSPRRSRNQSRSSKSHYSHCHRPNHIWIRFPIDLAGRRYRRWLSSQESLEEGYTKHCRRLRGTRVVTKLSQPGVSSSDRSYKPSSFSFEAHLSLVGNSKAENGTKRKTPSTEIPGLSVLRASFVERTETLGEQGGKAVRAKGMASLGFAGMITVF